MFRLEGIVKSNVRPGHTEHLDEGIVFRLRRPEVRRAGGNGGAVTTLRLAGWEGLEEYWTVKDGVISGHETKDKSKQTFLVWKGGKPGDFELHLKYKFATPDGNSGARVRRCVTIHP